MSCSAHDQQIGGSGESPLTHAWRQHVSPDVALLDRLVARHREKHRRYHGLSHLDAIVETVIDLGSLDPPDDLGAVVAAAFYHDAIYEPESPANERASARLARRDLATLGWTDARAAHVGEMIEATKGHLAAPDTDHGLLFDADLAILGTDAESYAAYVEQVRSEFRHVDDGAWRTGRSDFLRMFLERDTIYSTHTARDRWERPARANLASELSSFGD